MFKNSYIAFQIVKVDSILLFFKLSQYFCYLYWQIPIALKFDSSLIHDAINYLKWKVENIFERIQVKSISQSNYLIKKMEGTEMLGF